MIGVHKGRDFLPLCTEWYEIPCQAGNDQEAGQGISIRTQGLSSYIQMSEAEFTQNEVEGLNYDAMTPKYIGGELCRKSRSE